METRRPTAAGTGDLKALGLGHLLSSWLPTPSKRLTPAALQQPAPTSSCPLEPLPTNQPSSSITAPQAGCSCASQREQTDQHAWRHLAPPTRSSQPSPAMHRIAQEDG
ncbi:uncharacterized protein B0I36DRAFT_405618 [Microdochium trichocladiopsis]|uniref:Uncharacterized protein n=1 Tax=Microdochium trichocladiopsis TaxID=1682393 RepID=A0A9P9BWI1_9PEZI|nr:uncharacterized protein B0I36DRAFT_405618 [Microdochium trichocladiopsis]KAH7035101.1 hypothetical protein B0I36DRAFT_405618 [Microdochium trichocladiopsis]